MKRVRKTNHYISRERMDIRVGSKVVCTVIVDYIPAQMRDRLARLKGAASGDISKEDVWAQVELIPGPEMKLDASTKTFKTAVRVDEMPAQTNNTDAEVMFQKARVAAARAKCRQIVDARRVNGKVQMPKN